MLSYSLTASLQRLNWFEIDFRKITFHTVGRDSWSLICISSFFKIDILDLDLKRSKYDSYENPVSFGVENFNLKYIISNQ